MGSLLRLKNQVKWKYFIQFCTTTPCWLKGIDDLLEICKNHLNIEYIDNLPQGIYKDKKIVITGSFENFKRSEIEVKLRSLGGKVLSSISKNTDFLIAGKDAGSKLQKAESMNIDIKGIEFVNDLMNN